MNKSIHKFLIQSILTIIFLITGCSKDIKNDDDENIIKVGNFTVKQQQYENRLKKLLIIQGMQREEAALFLLDNYISAGLLVESAKKLNYNQHLDFLKRDSINKEQLVIKYSKYIRAVASESLYSDNQIIAKMMQKNIKIDYIRIPDENRELSISMYNYLVNGEKISNILNNPSLSIGDKNGLSFYENIWLSHAILTDKIIKKIIMMQDNEVKIIKDKSAYYVVRFLHSTSSNFTVENEETVLLNFYMAKCLEKGDFIFDPFRLERAIKSNEDLLNNIDFSISPFYLNNYVAKFGDRLISEHEIKEKISELPVQIQCLFMNKSTRLRAIASLLLNHTPKNINDWLQPDKINNYHQLSLNYDTIEQMEIIRKNIVGNQILAYSDKWNITVMDFIKEIDKLTPITRLDIAYNNLSIQMIEYIARNNNISHSQLVINKNLFDSIDIIGKSYDQLNCEFNENDIVGTLENIVISVKELRKLVEKMTETEKIKFMDLSTRKDFFNTMLIKKFWFNLYDLDTIENLPDFQNELSNHRNKLLSELIYEKELQSNVPHNTDILDAFLQITMKDYPIQVNTIFLRKKYLLNVELSKYYHLIKNLN